MKPFYALLFSLIFLLLLIFLALIISPLDGVTGSPHPDFKGMMISAGNTDQQVHTKWLGYLFALGVLAVFMSVLFIANRKYGKVTGMGKWLGIFAILYTFVFSLMIFSNWDYVNSSDNRFIGQMPKPTAWMIYVIWLFPFFITIVYVLKFNDWVISPEEEKELSDFLEGK